jgi:type II secretory pathway pseudopilin PulG
MFCTARQLRRRRASDERGYVLLTLLLMVAVATILLAAVLPEVTFEIRRDREEEMVHRGVEYSRAIRNYYKKFGRYPARLEELESTNNQRFLRKRYKDPIAKNKDFKLLHFGDVKMTLNNPLTQVSNLNGANPPSAPGLGSQPGFGGPAGNSLGASPTPFGAANRPSTDNANPTPDQNQPTVQGQPSDPTAPGQNPTSQAPGDQPGQQPGGTPDRLTSQTFGGGAIVGVASTSKENGIREFNHKRKYSDWQFIYDPAMDRGGLPTTPYQPALPGFGNSSIQQANPNNPSGPQPGTPQPGTQQPGTQNLPNVTGPPTD